MKKIHLTTFRSLVLAAALIAPSQSWAALSYWDIDGAIPGAGGPTPSGTWSTINTNWSPDLNGAAATGGWVPGDTAVFAAGTDAIGAYTVTVSGTQNASGINVEEGTVTLVGGTVTTNAVANASMAIIVSSGATLATDSSARISVPAGASTITLNGGTLRSINPGNNGTFIDQDFEIILGSAGGTFSYAPLIATNLSIVQTLTKISGAGSLTKTGAGVLAIASNPGNNTYTGGTIVNDGELRMRGLGNPLPITTDLTVNAPGIFNLNIVSQQVGSLSGDGRVGLGNATLTVSGSSNTIYTGTIADTASIPGSGGTLLTGGKLIKAGTSTLTLTSPNTYTGGTTINGGTLVANNVAGSATGTSNVTVNAGGTLAGRGTVTGATTLNTGSTISPGFLPGPGTINTGTNTWGGGANYTFEINNATGTAGGALGWDLNNITGGLTLAATPGNPFNINLTSLTLGNTPGDAAGFTNTLAYAFKLATASGGITGFDPAAFNINTAGFSNPTGGGMFFMTQNGNDLFLNFAPVPEPSTVALGLLGGAGMLFSFMRRRRS